LRYCWRWQRELVIELGELEEQEEEREVEMEMAIQLDELDEKEEKTEVEVEMVMKIEMEEEVVEEAALVRSLPMAQPRRWLEPQH